MSASPKFTIACLICSGHSNRCSSGKFIRMFVVSDNSGEWAPSLFGVISGHGVASWPCQRALAAALAISRRRSGVSLAALAMPPFPLSVFSFSKELPGCFAAMWRRRFSNERLQHGQTPALARFRTPARSAARLAARTALSPARRSAALFVRREANPAVVEDRRLMTQMG